MDIAEYLLKFSLCIAAPYVFYKVLLRPLTFYQWNRFYLLAHALFAFVLPLINIVPWIQRQHLNERVYLEEISSIAANVNLHEEWSSRDWLLPTFFAGTFIMVVRLAIRYYSLWRLHKQSVLVGTLGELHVYETRQPAGPFSFGNSIYINSSMHVAAELPKIIHHEIVHIRQQHTIDIIAGEVICLLNWFNPFAWLMRKVIRENLEFIADDHVLAKGHDIKEYQYLLLKVAGIPQYSIANNFGLSHLKKRITMMNKMKSAKIHLAKFLFALPLLLFMIVAFSSAQMMQQSPLRQTSIDTVPAAPPPPPAVTNAPPPPPLPAPPPPPSPVVTLDDNAIPDVVPVPPLPPVNPKSAPHSKKGRTVATADTRNYIGVTTSLDVKPAITIGVMADGVEDLRSPVTAVTADTKTLTAAKDVRPVKADVYVSETQTVQKAK